MSSALGSWNCCSSEPVVFTHRFVSQWPTTEEASVTEHHDYHNQAWPHWQIWSRGRVMH